MQICRFADLCADAELKPLPPENLKEHWLSDIGVEVAHVERSESDRSVRVRQDIGVVRVNRLLAILLGHELANKDTTCSAVTHIVRLHSP